MPSASFKKPTEPGNLTRQDKEQIRHFLTLCHGFRTDFYKRYPGMTFTNTGATGPDDFEGAVLSLHNLCNPNQAVSISDAQIYIDGCRKIYNQKKQSMIKFMRDHYDNVRPMNEVGMDPCWKAADWSDRYLTKVTAAYNKIQELVHDRDSH